MEEDVRVVKERFESQRGIQLEILGAQVTLTRARFNVVSALAQYGNRPGAVAQGNRPGPLTRETIDRRRQV